MSPTVDEAKEALVRYDEAFLECRNLGHVWGIRGYFRGARGVVVRALQCGRCETTRQDRWGTNGDRIGAGYTYPEGYRIEGVRVTGSSVRVEMVRRAVVYASEDEMFAALAPPRARKAVR